MWIMLCMKSDDRQQISRRFVMLTLILMLALLLMIGRHVG